MSEVKKLDDGTQVIQLAPGETHKTYVATSSRVWEPTVDGKRMTRVQTGWYYPRNFPVAVQIYGSKSKPAALKALYNEQVRLAKKLNMPAAAATIVLFSKPTVCTDAVDKKVADKLYNLDSKVKTYLVGRQKFVHITTATQATAIFVITEEHEMSRSWRKKSIDFKAKTQTEE
jgi:hypothetical protein